jgi:lysozyme family protein
MNADTNQYHHNLESHLNLGNGFPNPTVKTPYLISMITHFQFTKKFTLRKYNDSPVDTRASSPDVD